MPIASNFRDVMSFTVAAVDKAFAEPLRIRPMVVGRYTTTPKADPERPVRAVVGIYTEKQVKHEMLDAAPGMGRNFGSDLLVADLSLSVQTSALYVDDVLVLPQKGDQIDRTEIAGAPALEIVAVDNDGALRTVFKVVRVQP